MQIAAWQIVDGIPIRADQAAVDLEKDLEAWIEQDPALVDDGLTIVARQAQLPPAGRADLLAIDSAGRWVVIEIKAGALYRETVAQALDYAARVADATPEMLRQLVQTYLQSRPDTPRPTDEAAIFDAAPRDVDVIVVGSDSTLGIERLANYLSGFSVPIRTVAFQILEMSGTLTLIREVVEADQPPTPNVASTATVDAVLASADEGIRVAVLTVIDAATSHGLGIRPYKRSVMITPPQNRARSLITIWNLGATAKIFFSMTNFEEFFGIKPDVVRDTFGPLYDDNNRDLDQQVAQYVVAGLNGLLTGKP